MNQKNSGPKAFTLVELLVVVAIVALLTALLLPGLSTAKERSQAASCVSGLRQTGMAFNTYLNDHSGYYPYISAECIPTIDPSLPPCSQIPPVYNASGVQTLPTACPTSASGINWDPSCSTNLFAPVSQGSACCLNNWVYDLAPYLAFPADIKNSPSPSYSVLRCPSNPWGFPGTMRGNYGSHCTDRMNGNMFPSTYRGPWSSACSGGCAPGDPTGWNKMVNLTDISHPSSLMLVGETVYCASANNPWGQVLWEDVNGAAKSPAIGSCYVTNYIAGGCDNHFGVSQYTERQLTPTKYSNALVAYFHFNRMNILMTDGHVGQIDRPTLGAYSVEEDLLYLGNQTQLASDGNVFWNDGKAFGWYGNQFPGGPWPYNQVSH